MTVHLDMAVGDIAIRSPGANRVFWRHGIAYGCWGHRTIRDSCQRIGIDPVLLTREIDAAKDPLAVRWEAMSTTDLVRVMQVRYHEPMLIELERLTLLARDSAIADRGRNPVLMIIAPLVARLSIELKRRIRHEEDSVFPAILAETAYSVLPPETTSDDQSLSGQLLDDIRALTGGYSVQEAYVDMPMRSLYIGLQMLDMDIQEHLHVENHLLFRRAHARIRP